MSTASNNLFSQQTGHKYTFQLELKKLYISPSLPFDIKIVWARGQNRIQSQNPIRLLPPQNQVILQQCFCNKSTVLYNSKRHQFRKKQSKIQVILYANGSPKQGGQHLLNLCQILDPFNINKLQEKTYRVVTRQQKPRCELQFKLTAEYCQQMIRDQNRSIGSGVGSLSSKNTTSMAIGMMISSDQKNYIQKKNLFLYEAPSKDNQSVASYTSYNPGVMKYGSSKKERDDSTSVRKQQYGIAKRETQNIFNKKAQMKSDISKEYEIKSKPGSYTRFTQQLPAFDNRTQNFDATSNKQLVDEQSKRSKLQAQVSRLNIYMKQQSNKLTEYIQENTRLKEQLNRMSKDGEMTSGQKAEQIKKSYEQTIDKQKRQSGQLHNRMYQLNNQNKQLHRSVDELVQKKQSFQEQLRRLRLQKQRAQTKYDLFNRNMQTLVLTRQNSSKQMQNYKDQLQHMKSLNMNLRQNLQKQRRKVQQLQNNNQYQMSSLQDTKKKRQQRLYQLQRQNTTLMAQIRERQRQTDSRNDIMYRLQKTNQQYKLKIIQNQSEKLQMNEENKLLRSEVEKIKKEMNISHESLMKMRDQKTAQYEQKNISLESVNYQNQLKIRSLQYQNQQGKKNYTQIFTLNDTLRSEIQNKKNEICRLESNSKSLKQVQSKYYSLDKMTAQKQRELSFAKQQSNKLMLKVTQLQDLTRKLTSQLQESRKKTKQNPHSEVDVNQILRESVQMQVQLKFKTDELLRLKGIEQKFQDLTYQQQIQQRNRYQAQQDQQRLQKQLKQKSKLYLIEVQKGKFTLIQKQQLQKALQDVRAELKHCQEIIFNGDKQVKQMELHIRFMQSESMKTVERIRTNQQELISNRQRVADAMHFQNRIKQMQRQVIEKGYTFNLLTSNLSISQKKITELEYHLKGKQAEVQQVKKLGQSTSQRIIQIQETKNIATSELQRVLNEKKASQLKCEFIMQQLHALKKKFEEQKGRSSSIVSIRSSQQQMKIRQLQNQVQKRDKVISKLTKQKLQIQEENINLHVQVMKKLSQMEKSKDNSHIYSSQKMLTTPK